MNKSDSDLMELSLQSEGFIPVDNFMDADIAVFNTCSVRKHAEDRATAKIREAKAHLKKRGGVVAVTGCMAQRIAEEFIKNKYADIAIGPYKNPAIGQIIKGYFNGNKERIFISQEKESFTERINPGLVNFKEANPWHKWVTITHGCENFCTYCIVPYVRGRLISFSSSKILEYIKKCADTGVFEVTLLGQNVNQYGQDNGEIPFHELLEKTAQINGIKKINFLTSHPKDFSNDIIDVVFSNDNISKSIHLPLQSGSDNILTKMNRQYSLDHYTSVIEYIKSKQTPYALSTDLIVGFPGETEIDFQNTLNAVEKFSYDEAFMYAYSPRVGTKAADSENAISEEIKQKRLRTLIDLQRKITESNMHNCVGTKEKLVVEGVSKKSDNKLIGKTWLNHSVVVDGNSKDIGNIFDVNITGIKGTTLLGELL